MTSFRAAALLFALSAAFTDNELALSTVLLLEDEDIKELFPKIGQRLKFRKKIEELKLKLTPGVLLKDFDHMFPEKGSNLFAKILLKKEDILKYAKIKLKATRDKYVTNMLRELLSLVDVCQSAHSDRTRQRSGPIRSVPVAADIKRDNNFDCPEEFGYYPHPTDCTQYYVCVFGGALLESCTGGLMYSHELQTCDWPRNVGCDAIGTSIDGEELERVIEKKPLPLAPAPPSRRVPPPLPPPPPRVQPNPIVTSRGQPKFNRDEYEKQQQLYAEVDDLPPVEEIESDRQQRVYRGQPSTIGQVQRDRDGYAQVSSGRTLNSNIIPASIPQNHGKIGSFSFGTQVEERRPTATVAPQSYSEDISDLTDSHDDRQSDVMTNVIDDSISTKTQSRRKRETASNESFAVDNSTVAKSNATLGSAIISKKNDGNFEDYVETETEYNSDKDYDSTEDGERDKRQVRHGRFYFKDGYIKPSSGKIWASPKPPKLFEIPQFNFNIPENSQNIRYQPTYNSLNHNNFFDATRKPTNDVNSYSTANPLVSYQTEATSGPQSQKPFKASALDPASQKHAYNPENTATQIITKSPPISALISNENPFASFGGFYNNNPKQTQNSKQFSSQILSYNHRPSNYNSFTDSSQLPSTVVTGKPILTQTPRTKYKINQSPTKSNIESEDSHDQIHHTPYNHKPTTNDDEASNESIEDDINSSEESSSENGDDHTKHEFPAPPYEFTHPINKFADIKNPFADPNFDFDAFISKLSEDHQKSVAFTTRKPNYNKHSGFKHTNHHIEPTAASPLRSGLRSSTLNYHGMSTPRPFSVPAEEVESWSVPNPTQSSTRQPLKFEQLIQRPNEQQEYEKYRQEQQQQQYNQQKPQQQHQQQQQQNLKQQQQQQYSSSINDNIFNRFQQQNAGTQLEAIKAKLKPPNFNDDRQLPINFNFNQGTQSTMRPTSERNHHDSNSKNKEEYSPTQKPYLFLTGTRSPIFLSTPKQQFVNIQSQFAVTGKPYSVSSIKPQNSYYAFKESTPKPLTTIAEQQLTALQNYWKAQHSTIRPTALSENQNRANMFRQAMKSTAQTNISGYNHNIILAYTPKQSVASTTTAPTTRRPIPKPSPEMNDYYYDDDEQYYYEPPVKSQYMPSTEIRPQRPPMAQNYQEYEDESYEDDESSENSHQRPSVRRPANYNSYKIDADTKNHDDVQIITKVPHKNMVKNNVKNAAISFNSVTPTPNVLQRPEVTNYKILHYPQRNKTMYIKRPESGPNTVKPPKYLNQTTLRPYTVRHRLAKPTTVRIQMTQTTQSQEVKPTRGPTRHPNIVTQMRVTTPRDSHNQETRYTKTRHDDRSNSLEPTESVTPTPYSASPRPKMLYNGSQSYSPDQFDPYYAVYDEDGELYKDNDYVQQYNLASLRPAVQQTYRGTPPPARRPVETYTTRPVTAQDYDDALLQGQINNQNQYQTPIRHSTRGEGNDLEYDNNPSSVRTTVYEATSISTTPSTTTSTSTTTTQRPTVAPITEAMTPSRFTIRSSTDANPVENPESPSSNRQTSKSESHSSIPLTTPPVVNFSSLAKPFERTDNTYRLRETLTSTERLPTPTQKSSHMSNSNELETVRVNSNQDDKKVVSLTSGFSIRRNSNNTNNPYTLTVLTRPFENYERSRYKSDDKNKVRQQNNSKRYYYDSDNVSKEEYQTPKPETDNASYDDENSSDRSSRRTDSIPEIISEEGDVPIFVRPTARVRVVEPNIKTSTPTTTTIASKFFLKTVIKRPVPFSHSDEQPEGSTNNIIDTETLIEKALQNSQYTTNDTYFEESPQWDQYDQSKESFNEPAVGPYETLNNLRNSYSAQDDYNVQTTTTTSAPRYIPTTPKTVENRSGIDRSGRTSVKPTYYTYRIIDDHVQPNHTTEFFNTKAKNLLMAFFSNIVSSPKPQPQVRIISSTSRPATESEMVVNIGFHKKYLRLDDEKPLRTNVQRLQIITEPGVGRYISPTIDTVVFTEPQTNSDVSSTTTSASVTQVNSETVSMTTESTTNSQYRAIPSREMYNSRFSTIMTSENPENQYSSKFRNLVTDKPATETRSRGNISYNNEDNELTRLTGTNFESNREYEYDGKVNQFTSTTTSTTKATTTVKYVEPTTSTKSLPFPTRASRVNPAIKLAAANPGGGRRSYQSSSKCSSDNSLQENPKCNEIKYQRPSLPTRGRGSAHYSTLNGNEASQQQTSNRGTPPTRSRPTLKPSTAIVSKSTEFVDIYTYPPRRPGPVYPQPTPDKTAAKCRKDVCLLPDCYCGGKDIPGDMAVESVPQIVLLTFDDSVNDLNKVLYSDLFEKGRVNPNGCPISATFYVSHEWTDYSQVQNLYAAGHEMASHTISHSFGEQFSQKKWNREVAGQREILAAYGGVKLEDVRGMRAPFLSVGGNKMFKMLYDSNFTYDSSMPVYENRPPSWPYTLDYKLFHDCMIPPCPTKSYPGVWEVPMVMWQDLNGGRCSMGDACANPPNAEGVYKMLLKNFDRHYTTNRAPFGLFYHAAWFTQPHHKEGFIMFLDFINRMNDVYIVTNWQALQWVRDPTPINRLNNFQPFQCDYPDRPKKCNNPKVCNLWHKSGVRYMRTCQPCPEVYPWTGKTGIRSSRIDNDIEE